MLTRHPLSLNPLADATPLNLLSPLVVSRLRWALRAFCLTLVAHALIGGVGYQSLSCAVHPSFIAKAVQE